MTPEELREIPPQLGRASRRALIVGAAALLPTLAGALVDPQQFFRSYLWSYAFWVGVPLGCMGIVMLQHVTGGRWGITLRRMLESGAGTLPFLALGFVPLLFGLRSLYVWARPDAVAADEILQHKAAYLNVPFFLGRAAFYFVVWSLIAYFLNRWSTQQDDTLDEGLSARLRTLSGPGIAIYVLTVTFASIDWIMSLEPHWFSTIFGGLFLSGQVLAALSFVVAVLVVLCRYRPLAEMISADRFHDMGKLMLAFVMVWAYFAFSQFLIIWAGNLPEEIPWYLRRLQGNWQYFGLALVALHFVLPFLLLLSVRTKRRPETLRRVAILVIFMRVVDVYWTTAPAFEGGFRLHWLDVTAPLALGGLWTGLFLWRLGKRPLLPIGDPYLRETLGHVGK